jgi:hypothetical protein
MDDRPPLLPGARRAPRALRCLPGSHFDPYLDQFPLAAAAGTEWFREHLLSPGVNRSWPMLRSTAASPWPIPTLRIPHKQEETFEDDRHLDLSCRHSRTICRTPHGFRRPPMRARFMTHTM